MIRLTLPLESTGNKICSSKGDIELWQRKASLSKFKARSVVEASLTPVACLTSKSSSTLMKKWASLIRKFRLKDWKSPRLRVKFTSLTSNTIWTRGRSRILSVPWRFHKLMWVLMGRLYKASKDDWRLIRLKRVNLTLMPRRLKC